MLGFAAKDRHRTDTGSISRSSTISPPQIPRWRDHQNVQVYAMKPLILYRVRSFWVRGPAAEGMKVRLIAAYSELLPITVLCSLARSVFVFLSCVSSLPGGVLTIA